jgi:hypothetical protein
MFLIFNEIIVPLFQWFSFLRMVLRADTIWVLLWMGEEVAQAQGLVDFLNYGIRRCMSNSF